MRTREEWKRAVAAEVDAAGEQIAAIGETVWKNQESGYREFKTSRLAVETLRNLDL